MRSTPEQVPEWQTVGRFLDSVAAANPLDLAVAFEDGTAFTRAELVARADRVAAGLSDLGVGHGDRVMTVLYNSPEQVLVFLACARLGAVAVPVNVSTRPHDLKHVVDESRPVAIILEPETVSIYLDARDSFEHVVQHELLNRPDGRLPFFDANPDVSADRVGPAPQQVVVSPTDPMCILFTGGTTGLPKGVVRSHYSYLCAASRYASIFEPVPGDRHMGVSQLFHCGGQEVDLLGPLMFGVPSLINRWFSASQHWKRAQTFGATLGNIFGPVMTALLAQAPSDADSENNYRILATTTSGLTESQVKEFQDRFAIPHMLEVFAMSETGTLLFTNTVDDQRPGSVGISRGWCEVVVADEDDRPLPVGAIGAVLLRPTVAHSMSEGYFGRPRETLEHWRNLWIHTGDRGFLDEEGWLYFTGREAHWIRRRGENLSSAEVEAVINAMPGVVESAVTGVPSPLGDDEIVAVVVVDQALSPDDVFQGCTKNLAYFKVPTRILVTRERLPRTAAKNEIERFKVKDMDLDAAWAAPPRKRGS